LAGEEIGQISSGCCQIMKEEDERKKTTGGRFIKVEQNMNQHRDGSQGV
jgi:hypothetical protein